ncbi:MAG: hypothetical protein CBHOC_0992 [uncultured Caballeronia sp.]|nr:MAG: hypothetical protein CBHOC_0992 [uncultured Caballeronia sp.]
MDGVPLARPDTDAQRDTPLYLQLASQLAKAIHAGTWTAGEALPSERSLSEGSGCHASPRERPSRCSSNKV